MKIKYILVTFLTLLVLLSLIGTAYAAESVEIRSEVLEYYPGDSSSEIYPDQWAALYYDVKNSVQTEKIYFADCDIRWSDGGPSYTGDNWLAPGHVNILYSTTPAFQEFEYDWSILVEAVPQVAQFGLEKRAPQVSVPAGFAVLGFFGEPYVALSDEKIIGYACEDHYHFHEGYDDFKANKIAPLVVNDDAKYVSKTGESLDLGNGYSLLIDQISLSNNQVHLILMKDGQQLETNIVDTNSSKDWILKTTVLGDEDRQVLRVHVEDVFRGNNDDLVTIDGLWLVDYLNAVEVKSDVDYGKWEATYIASDALVYIAKDVALNSNSVIQLGKDWNIRVQDGFEIPIPIPIYENGPVGREPIILEAANRLRSPFDLSGFNNRFYLFKEYTEPGKYDIRSSISSTGNYDLFSFYPSGIYSYFNFAAFYYDLDEHLFTEFLSAAPYPDYYGGSRVFVKESESFMYVTTSVHTDYEYAPGEGLDEDENIVNSWDSGYDIMGYFGEKYVPLNVVDLEGFHIHDRTKIEKFAPLVTDENIKYTLAEKDQLDLGKGYSLRVSQISIDGNQAYLELYKDNVLINSSIVTTKSGNGSGNWIYKETVLNVKDVQLMRVHVKDVFNGGKTNLVEIDAVWLTDFKNVTELNQDDEFGLLIYKGLRLNEYNEYSPRSLVPPIGDAGWLVFCLKNDLTMTDEMDVVIANGMSLKAFESEMPRYYSLRQEAQLLSKGAPQVRFGDYNSYNYYFYVTKEIGNSSSGDDGNTDGNGGEGNDGKGNDGNSNGNNDNTGNPKGEGSKRSFFSGVGALIAFFAFLAFLMLLTFLSLRYRARKKQIIRK